MHFVTEEGTFQQNGYLKEKKKVANEIIPFHLSTLCWFCSGFDKPANKIAISEWDADVNLRRKKNPIQLNALKASSKWLRQSFDVLMYKKKRERAQKVEEEDEDRPWRVCLSVYLCVHAFPAHADECLSGGQSGGSQDKLR